MSQEAVERVLGRMITDKQFCRLAVESLESVSRLEGYPLSPTELRLLSEMKQQYFAELSGRLDPGLCRA